MAKANTYKLREDITADDLDKLGFKHGFWQSKYKDRECMSKSTGLFGDIELNICIRVNPIGFDDFEDILVLDEDFGQPYTPFYGDNYKKDITDFDFLEKVIDRYNQAMDIQGVFETVD